jgi:type VI protein secretion system component VasK
VTEPSPGPARQPQTGSDATVAPTAPAANGAPLARSTVVALVVEMVLLISLGLVISFGAPWPWWLIPGAALATVVVIMGTRWRRYRLRQEAATHRRPAPTDRDRHEAI